MIRQIFLLTFSVLSSTSVYAGSAILNLSGTNNILNLAQTADSSLLFGATSMGNDTNVYTVKQVGGGNHHASIDIEGNFQNYDFYLSQNSSQDLSISITQTCNQAICNPASPYIFNQY